MKLLLNGTLAEFETPLTLEGLLMHHRLKPETVVVEYNFQVPRKEAYPDILLQEGDRVEIVKFMGGG